MYETPPLFYGILPWFECVLAAVIPVILVSFQSPYKWFKKQTQGQQLQSLRTFLDDKIFQLETIAYKDQPTKEECLTFQIELPGLHVFARELKELANELHPGLGNHSSILYNTKLISIQNAMSDYISKHFPTCTCDCPKSDCWAQKEHKRLLGLSEYDFLCLACTRSLHQGKEIQALIFKCEKFVERWSSVTPGKICNDAVRLMRKFLLSRAETLESKLSLLSKEQQSSTPILSDCTAGVDENLYR